MKQVKSIPFLLISLALISQSCTKQSPDKRVTITTTPAQTINATVSAKSPYSLNVNNMGDVSVSKQAAHFELSQTETDPKDGTRLYKYVPQGDYAGTDEVELLASKTSYSTGTGCNSGRGEITTYNSTIVIKFTVSK
ncbi:MAG: hypothetical protein ABI760_16795 [Ferruginibacter sp.]